MSRTPDVIVIGAGPYGLAAAAQLRWAGADVRVFGVPMSFWMRHMPKGMLLRSPWAASHIGNEQAAPTLDTFERTRGSGISRPIPLADFVAYGLWVQQRAAPEADPRRVELVAPTATGLRVQLEDGESVDTGRVVVAAGISEFAWRPPEFSGLPPELAGHSSEHADLARFAGRRVVVIGGGQSALESAVLLREAGADVELIVRAPRMHWVGRATRDGILGRLLFDRTDVGPALISHVVAKPLFYRRLSPSLQRSMTRRSLVAGAATWLRPRATEIPITLGRHVTQAVRMNGHLRLTLDDGGARDVDQVLLATGYRVDLARYGFLSPEILRALRLVEGYPLLDNGFQSDVPGLHFIGATAVGSFGPLVRFVSGTSFVARTLAQQITGSARALVRTRMPLGPTLADSGGGRTVSAPDRRSSAR
jgi:FAD-dependent urate hydroxylase